MKKHRATFRTFYLLYVLLLIVALVFVYSYVRKTLIAYEKSGSEQTAISLVKEAAKGNSALAKYMEKNCFNTSSESGRYGDPAARNKEEL